MEWSPAKEKGNNNSNCKEKKFKNNEMNMSILDKKVGNAKENKHIISSNINYILQKV
jgi:hypothetical protein